MGRLDSLYLLHGDGVQFAPGEKLGKRGSRRNPPVQVTKKIVVATGVGDGYIGTYYERLCVLDAAGERWGNVVGVESTAANLIHKEDDFVLKRTLDILEILFL